MWKETVSVSPPYHFDRVLDRLSLDPLNAVNLDKREVKLPLRNQNKEPRIVAVQATGTVEAPAFAVSGTDDRDAMMKEVKRIFRWEENLQPVLDHFSQSSLSSIFAEHAGTPLVLDFHLYHCLMKCMIHQQLNLSFAYTLTERFVHTYGEQKDGVWFYPLPETIAQLDYNDLRELQFSMRKAEYVIDTSRMIADGRLNLDELDQLSDEDIMEKLVKIRGIGPWTVQNVLLFGLGRPNLFPAADIGIQNAIKRHFGLNDKPTKEQMLEMSKEWHPYLSYASLYLWRSIE
ncbi:DNA-3-methyladenine glycosylase family protein [Bacillus paralicheniformis]|uniref:DNA-3-methyladenine glycosylase family protein n=1 Tax=Bacillus TaxID=1386 RepID=UPI000399D405|nr:MULTISPECIES: DNA-3-methyladenine glycosylase [Bacillus]ETB72085.1 DNA-3-methyladenine glycosylase [Bacillus sp. CPSM8]POO77072.1 DNA-3-methyladenine glycosylase 2 family protein [Bacillus sp. MBGLi97]AJO17078.1 DNA glycosylase [Bacillus paralicheniformis]ARA84767.1 DNA-3-methyladenine glycosylase [Bacillus paralicheniformis]AUZ37740.1 DNA-3-methyladenine glycosylase 2 family protein [Bacillus sp. MBGLi79]